MESLIKQTRVKYSGAGKANQEEYRSERDVNRPPERTQSFKGEKKRSQSWLRRQFSRQMTQDYDSSDDLAYPTAVAAAAFAVHSLEETRFRERSRQPAAYGPDGSSTELKNKEEVKGILRKRSASFSGRDAVKGTLRKRSVSFSDETSKTSSKDYDDRFEKPEDEVFPAKSMKKKPRFADSQPEKPVPQKADEPAPSSKPTRTRSKKPESEVSTQTSSRRPEIMVPKSDRAPPKESTTPSVERKGHYSPRRGDTLADTWEKTKMAKIEERYEELRDRFQTWEAKKKEKTRHRLQKTENELSDTKRTKAIAKYRKEMARIEEIAAGAREQAKENRRNKEFKVKAKANKIRATGKLPPKCLCF